MHATRPATNPAVEAERLFAGKYRIASTIGQGGMGLVYKAHDETLGRPIALKLLAPSLVDSAEAEERVLDLALQIASGLGEAHRKGVIHRDIKSANIMVTPEGRAKIMDFGLAKLQGASDLTKSLTTMGTVPYMSPEQARGERVDHRTDLWSLGVVLYEMLSGDLPFGGDTDLSVIHSIVHDPPSPLKTLQPPVPDAMKAIVGRALTKRKDARYGSAGEMLQDLKEHHASLQLAGAGVLNVRTLWRRLRRPGVALPAVAILSNR